MLARVCGNNDIREKMTKALLLGAALAVLLSIFFPYWYLSVKAPQYPKGLHVQIYLNRVTGDVREIDTLNHYIGMRPLGDAGKLEKQFALPGILFIISCLLVSIFVKGKFSLLLILPPILLPAVFAADLYFWLRDFGLNLNPHAALSSSIKPFIPPILGEGKIAQFHANANFAFGHGLSMLSAIFSFAAFLLRFSQNKCTARGKMFQVFGAIILTGLMSSHDAFARTLTVGESTYPTIRSAIDHSSDGDTILVKSGTYHESLIIEKSVRLVGERFPVIDGGGKGTVIRLNAPDSSVHGFVIRNSGDTLARDDAGVVVSGARTVIENNRFEDVLFGIDLKRAPRSVVRGNDLQGKELPIARRGDLIRVWYSDDVLVENNRAHDGRDVVLWYSKNIRVLGNHFERNRYGLHFMYCADSVIKRNILLKNSVGAYLMYSADIRLQENHLLENRGPSGYGIGLKDMTGAVVERNRVVNNRVGLFLDGSSKNFYRLNLIAYNDIGIQALPSSKENRFKSNNFVENTEQVNLEGASIHTINDWDGNYWNDYRGYDGNEDGIGEAPYESQRFFEGLTERFHELRIFYSSPVIQALDYASAAFPVFAPSPKFIDQSPLIRPVMLGFKPEPVPVAPLWFFVSGMLLFPTMVLFRAKLVTRALTPTSERLVSKSEKRVLGQPVIQVKGLTKFFKKHCALSDVNFEVHAGEAVALWGPNGAGKTTLLRCLLGISPFQGSAEILGSDVRKNGKKIRSKIGYVPQEIRHRPDQNVWEAISFYAQLRGVSSVRVAELVKEWGLWDSRDQLAQNLSGGMKQKLALAVALLSDPPLLFLDEPTSFLDSKSRREFVALLTQLKAAGKTLLFCSHRSAEVLKFADRVIVIENGLVQSDGKPQLLEDL